MIIISAGVLLTLIVLLLIWTMTEDSNKKEKQLEYATPTSDKEVDENQPNFFYSGAEFEIERFTDEYKASEAKVLIDFNERGKLETEAIAEVVGTENYVYPGIITKKESPMGLTYQLLIIDFDCSVKGNSLAEVITNAREFIALESLELKSEGHQLPKPFSVTSPEIKDGIETLIDVDLLEYRQLVVNKKVVISKELDDLLLKSDLNLSQLLTETLKNKLMK